MISIFGGGGARGRRCCCDSGKWKCRLGPQSFRFFLVIICFRSFDHLSIDLKIWNNERRMSVCHSRGKSHEDWYTWWLCILGLSCVSYLGIYSWVTSGTLHIARIGGTLCLRIKVQEIYYELCKHALHTFVHVAAELVIKLNTIHVEYFQKLSKIFLEFSCGFG